MPVLHFKGKTAVENHHHTVPHHRLEFDPKLSLLPKGQKPSLDGNLIIEGDNLLALKALLPTHAGKVKCIYIDPPYNTGNEGWVYNDNLTQPQFKAWFGKTVGKEGEDACRHDKWCCMMYPRLVLLKELLREDGSIWISIDDNEVHRLRGVMDEVFGEECFSAQVAVLNNRKGRGLRTGFAQSHDYLVVYCRRPEGCSFETAKSASQIETEYPERDDVGPLRWLELRNTHREFGKHNRPKLFFPLFVDTTDGSVHLDARRGRVRVAPIWEDGFEGCWSWGTAKVKAQQSDLIGRKVNGAFKVFRKSRPTPRKPKTLWHKKGFLTERGQTLLTAIFGKRVFHAPKPLDLLSEVVRFASVEGDIVLDACAGSGTTAHAVLKLNVEAKTPRRFVLIQQKHDSKADEEAKLNICQDITRERVRRVSEGKCATSKQPPLGGSFTYARVGDPLFNEYKDFGRKPPSFIQLARYVFYTHTSRMLDEKKVNEKIGFIGSTEIGGGTSLYLLYEPNEKIDREVSTKTLAALAKKDKNPNWVIYAERIWMHPDQRRDFENATGKSVKLMLVPFELK